VQKGYFGKEPAAVGGDEETSCWGKLECISSSEKGGRPLWARTRGSQKDASKIREGELGRFRKRRVWGKGGFSLGNCETLGASRGARYRGGRKRKRRLIFFFSGKRTNEKASVAGFQVKAPRGTRDFCSQKSKKTCCTPKRLFGPKEEEYPRKQKKKSLLTRGRRRKTLAIKNRR